MNKVSLIGRLTGDPEVRYALSSSQLCVARWTLAVDRRIKKDGEPTADFIRCVAFGKLGEHAEKYYRKGLKIAVSGRIQTGSYKNNEGKTVYTTDVIVEESEFAESKSAAQSGGDFSGSDKTSQTQTDSDGFMRIPDDAEELPFR